MRCERLKETEEIYEEMKNELERRSGAVLSSGGEMSLRLHAVAAELSTHHLAETGEIKRRRNAFEHGVIESLPDVVINGDPENRLPNTSNLYFPGVDGEGLLILLDEAGICCSPGSACSTGAVQPSRIVKAMGYSSSRARSSVRFSLSRFTTDVEIASAVAAIIKAVGKLRIVMPSGGSRVVSRPASRQD